MSEEVSVIVRFLLVFVFVACCILPTHVRSPDTIKIDFNAKMFSGLTEDEKKVIADYAKVFPRIQHFYGNMKMSVRHKVFQYTEELLNPSAKLLSTPLLVLDGVRDVRYRHLSEGELYSLVSGRMLVIDLGDASQEMPPIDHVTLITPSLAYELSKRNSENQYYSLNARKTTDIYLDEHGIVLQNFDTAPFAEMGTTLDQLFFRYPPFPQQSRDNYVVDSVRRIEENGRAYIEFRSHHNQ
jgi:hypothetical protein